MVNKIEWCCNFDIEVMFKNIKPFEYKKVIELLNEYYNIDYYKTLLKKIKNIKNNTNFLNKYDPYIEQMVIEYVKCRKNSIVITFYPNATNIFNDKKVFDFLNKNGNVYFVKDETITENGAKSLIYQLYANTPYLKNIRDIEYKVEKCGWDKNKENIKICVYELKNNNTNIRIFKETLRQLFINNTNDSNHKSYLHINDTFLETIQYTELYFNKNSMDFLNQQMLHRHLSHFTYGCHELLKKFKTWIYKNIPLLEIKRFLVFSSAILYVYGFRKCNDLDVFIYHLPISDELCKIIDKNVFTEKSVCDKLDVSMKGVDTWITGGPKEHWDVYFVKDWPESFGAKNIEEVVFNPKFHLNFIGLKFNTLEADLKRRIIRSRPSSFANIIAVDKFLYRNTKIILPHEYYKMQGVKNILNTPAKIDKFLTSIKYRLLERYQINISLIELKKIFKVL